MAISIKPLKYAENKTPEGYKCDFCNKTGVKLWREYQTFLDHQSLYCGECALKKANEDKKDKYKGPISIDGKITFVMKDGSGNEHEMQTDSIGWRIPAVPTEDGTTFWGYSSVPMDGVIWWKALPNEPLPSNS